MPSLPPIRPEDEGVALKTRPTGAFDAPVDEAHGRTLFELALRLGDDSLILGQRLATRKLVLVPLGGLRLQLAALGFLERRAGFLQAGGAILV